MIDAQPIGFANTVAPLAMIGGLAVAVPWVLLRKASRSHIEVAVTIWASAAIVMLCSAGIFAVAYALDGTDVVTPLAQSPWLTLRFFLSVSAQSALVWLPILALVWFGMAQRVERLRSEDGTRDG